MVLCARLESSLIHSCGVKPMELRRLSATKYSWTLNLPWHIDIKATSLPSTSLPQLPTAPPTPTSQLYHTTEDALPPPTTSSVPAGRSTLFLLVQIQIPTLNPYRRHAASQAKTSYPNDQNALPVFHNTQRTSNRIRKEKSWTWRESSNFETAVLACMIKQKFGPFSHVGGDDRLIDKVNPR